MVTRSGIIIVSFLIILHNLCYVYKDAIIEEGFGNCTNQFECEAVCPKSIKSEFISDLNRQYGTALVKEALK